MVQRKDPNKLGILADSKDYVESDKWSLALKPTHQYQDIQVKGRTELKKEMKKSRSIKLLDLENMELPPTRRAKSRFSKPPISASTAAVTPQTSSMINKRDPSPNYMKPTSSSDAKKERSQVNPLGYLASCPHKSLSPNPGRRNSSRMSPSPNPSGRHSHGISLSPSPTGRNSHRRSPSPSPSGRNSHRNSLSPCPSGRNSDHISTSPNSNGRNFSRNSHGPIPDTRNSNSLSFCSSLSGRYSNTKPCSASDHKPVKTSKKPSLKPVRTLTKTPSFKGGAELKKQIKKSRSIKLLDLDTLESSPVEHTNSASDESPGNISSAAVTPGNQSLMKTPDLLPNYMKPTSSFDARKEQLQVSTQGSQTSPSKSQYESNLIHRKPSSASGHKPARTLTKTSSLKPVKTLTKTSSLKKLRPIMKPRPDIASSSSKKAHRATCSSTLKDSRFPTSLTLSSGATESEGTSAMKVCPYTYCSLNGHHHAPLPQLKHFLLARRCLLKAQKNLQLKNLSPPQKKPPGKRKREIDIDKVAINDDPTAQAADLAPSAISPVMKEDDMDFFVEIYAKLREGTATSIGRSIQDRHDEATIDCAVNSNTPVAITSSVIYGTEIETENDTGKVHECIPNELSYSDISLKDNINQNSNLVADMDIPTSQQGQFIQSSYTDYHSCLIMEETGMECCMGKEMEGETTAGIELEESSEVTDMNWDNVKFDGLPSDESDPMIVHLPELKSPAMPEELVFKPEETVNKDYEEFPVDRLVQQQVHTENAESFSMEYGVANSEIDVACKEPAAITEEADGVPKPNKALKSMVYSASVEDALYDLTASTDKKHDGAPESEYFLQEPQLLGLDEIIHIPDVTAGDLVNEQESSLIFSNNLVGTNVGSNAEGKEQAEDAVELEGHWGKSSHTESSIGEEETMQVEDNMESDATEKNNSEDNITSSKKDEKIANRGNDSNQQLPMASINLTRTIRCRRPTEEQEEPRIFNPREPQFLDIEPEPEPEKVDLRHQMMDGRKNTEEWMLDYALQQAVTKLAPARKQKVALLVEAFEAVTPPPKCETHLPNTSAALAHARPIQACN